MRWCDLALDHVASLKPYQPGKPIEELQRQYGVQSVIKLASNENPLGPSKAALAAIAQTAKEITRYPDGNGYSLKKALAEKHQITMDQIILGNGSNDVLELAARAFSDADDEIIYSQYGFAIYGLVAKAVGATGVETLATEYGHDLTAMLAAITSNTKLIFIANPNNPTGTWIAPVELKTFLDKVPENVLVVLDEAYVEYLDIAQNDDAVTWLNEYPNLIVTRTFSKAYGLAGLRVGYAIANPQVIDLMNRIRQAFNVNSLAQAAAIASLGDKDYLHKSRQTNQAGMQQLEQAFEQRGLPYISSKANFITVDVQQDSDAVYEKLLYEGVIVRPVSGYGMPQHLRVSIGLEEENTRFINALDKVLSA